MWPPVRFGERHHHVGAAFGPAVPLTEHGVRLTDAGRGSEVDPQVPPSRPVTGTARSVGVHPAVVISHFWPAPLCALLVAGLLAAAHIHCEARVQSLRPDGRVLRRAGRTRWTGAATRTPPRRRRSAS